MSHKTFQLWVQIGYFLQLIMTPVILIFIFVLLIVPIAFLQKIFKKDLHKMGLISNPTKTSYWLIVEEVSSHSSVSMKRQF